MTNRLNQCLTLVAAISMTVAAGAANAATVFTDRDAFVASFNQPLVNETFDNDIDTATSITFDSGIVSTKSSTSVPPTLNRVKDGSYDGFVQRDGFRNITWEPSIPVFGLGGDFSAGGSAFNSLFVTASFLDGGSFTASITETLNRQPGFFGLGSARAFSSLIFTTDAGGLFLGNPVGGQGFTVDNVALAPIPLPAGLALMLGALGAGGAALGLSRRRGRPASA